MDDLISRRAAIDAICNACGKIDCDKMDKCEKLQLPPASCSEFPNNSDTISRQDAIDALDKRFDNVPMEQTTEILLLRKDLRELPSARPEQRTGKWIPQDHNKRAGNISTCVYCYPICSKCGKVGIETYKYCPMCGAKMEGADDE